MSLQKLCPTLMVSDVGHAVAFYVEVLDFTFVWGLEADSRRAAHAWPAAAPLAMALVRSGPVELSFQTRGFMASTLPGLANAHVGGSFILFLECDDLDALCDRLSERVPFLKAPHTNAHGVRQCSIQDPDGYILTFAQRANTLLQPPTETTR